MGYVIFGGGDLATEVASYVTEIASRGATALPSVTDVVSSGPPRIEALLQVVGTDLAFHKDIDDVPGLDDKEILICIGDAAVRHRIYRELSARGLKFGTVVHPSAVIAATARVASGSIICPFAFVGPFAEIGANAVLNVGAIVGHDAVLGASTVMSPKSDINGHARTGTAAFLGAGAVLNPKASLGAYSKLSAGSVLTGSTGDGFILHGNPAKGRQMIKVPPMGAQ